MIGRRSVLVIGGGSVGLAVAALLGSGNYAEALHVVLLEPRSIPKWDQKHVDLRVYALSRASQRMLQRIGAWHHISEARVSPYRRMRVWESSPISGLGSLDFDSADIGEPDLGHIVEDALLREALLRQLEALSNVELCLGLGLDKIEVGPRDVRVTTGNGEILSGNLLIAADGSDSRVRTLLGLSVSGMPYDQKAIVTHVGTRKEHMETAWQRFLKTGPLAFLPLTDGRSSVVWSMPSQHADSLLEQSSKEFINQLEVASEGILGGVDSVSARASFELRVMHSRQYCCPRVVLVGDAAHIVHPLAGQGMNMGFLDAVEIVDVIENALSRGEDPGDLRTLRRYERNRKGENLKMLLALDGLNRFFRFPGISLLRVAGLSAVNTASPVKCALMREALGLSKQVSDSFR
jgi:2-octaprenylphenol hydroxylase